ncbi:MAG: hypothetical protein HY308_17400 [Gammaproteobacteria bacterium]|nr:hypothetical protein [Gammaproteobacteria bacterium]
MSEEGGIAQQNYSMALSDIAIREKNAGAHCSSPLKGEEQNETRRSVDACPDF